MNIVLTIALFIAACGSGIVFMTIIDDPKGLIREMRESIQRLRPRRSGNITLVRRR